MLLLTLLLQISMPTAHMPKEGHAVTSISSLTTDAAIIEEVTTRPLATASDIYKLVHQSVFGPGHIIQNRNAAKNYLLREIASLESTGANERLYEELGGGVVRVNLRSFRDTNSSTEELLNAMINSAASNIGTAKDMTDKIKSACRVLMKQSRKSLAKELKTLAKKHAAGGYPALHHSEDYRNAYWPAYRVVDKRFLVSSDS